MRNLPTAVLAMLILTLTGAVWAPASAETWHRGDGDDPGMGYGDISRVGVDHAPRRVFTKVRYHQRLVGDSATIYFDTRRGNPGPEFALSLALDASGTHGVLGRRFARIDRFAGGHGDPLRCRGLHTLVTKRDAVRADVPRRCLAIGGAAPRRVRVSVQSVATYDGADGFTRSYDWSPARHRFGPWLRRA